MHATCPECHAVHEFKKPTRETRVTCKQCQTVFLTPVEYLCPDSGEWEDFKAVKKRLKYEFREEKRKLRQRHREIFAQFEKDKQQKTELEPSESDAQRVETPLSRKLLISVLSIYFLVVFCVDAVFMYQQYVSTKEIIIQELRNSEIMFKQGLSEAIWFMDESGLKAIIAGMLKHQLIIGVQVFDRYKDRIGAGGVFQDTGGNYMTFNDAISVDPAEKGKPFESRRHSVSLLFSYTFPITYHDEGVLHNIGKATVCSSGRFIFERVKNSYALILLNSFIVALALILVLLYKSRKILAQPLSVLTSAVTSLNLKNLDTLEVSLPTSDKNELKILEIAFNRMVKNLIDEQQANIRMTKTFEKFIPKQLLNRIATYGIHSIRTGEIANEKMTVLYCRINRAENMPSHSDIFNFRFLNEYLSTMNKAIEKHGGFMYKYSNNSIMAFFDLNDHPLEALSSVYAAIDMQKALRIFNQQQADQPPVSVSIGIDFGEIRLGTIGSENRIEATGIGNPIDAAVRLQQLTRKYQSRILITENILKLLRVFQACLTREVDSIRISETGELIKIFEVLDADPFREIKQQLLDSFQKGLDLFRERRWGEAEAYFEECIQLYPADAVTQLYLRRCHACETDNKVTVFLRNKCSLSPVLRGSDNIEQLARDFSLVTFQDGDCIMNAGEPGLSFYLMFEGSANVFFKKEDGTGLKVSTLKEGESFGEISMLTGNPVSATIISEGTSQLLVMNRDQFENMVCRYPQLNHYFHIQYSKYLADIQSVLLA
jgi:adenylate cyclase